MQSTYTFTEKIKLFLGKHHSQLSTKKRFKHWFKIKGDENHRLNYSLDKNSIVFDLGGYKGEWTHSIFEKYKCFVYCFEPVKIFVKDLHLHFSDNQKITVLPFGLGAKNETVMISHDADGSSIFRGGEKELIQIVEFNQFLQENKINSIDLIKINIEGAEYDLLEHLINTQFIKKIKNIQVQFHDFFPNAEERMQRIQSELAKTHHTTYHYKFIWENWEIKSF